MNRDSSWSLASSSTRERSADPLQMYLADVFTVIVEVDGSSTLTVKPPEKITNSPGWQLIAATAATTYRCSHTFRAGCSIPARRDWNCNWDEWNTIAPSPLHATPGKARRPQVF